MVSLEDGTNAKDNIPAGFAEFRYLIITTGNFQLRMNAPETACRRALLGPAEKAHGAPPGVGPDGPPALQGGTQREGSGKEEKKWGRNGEL